MYDILICWLLMINLILTIKYLTEHLDFIISKMMKCNKKNLFVHIFFHHHLLSSLEKSLYIHFPFQEFNFVYLKSQKMWFDNLVINYSMAHIFFCFITGAQSTILNWPSSDCDTLEPLKLIQFNDHLKNFYEHICQYQKEKLSIRLVRLVGKL